MAPKRGGSSGGSSGSSVSSCPGAFSTTIEQVYFANDVVFFVVLLGITALLCTIRKKAGAGKKLLGIPYMLALFFYIITYACSILATILQQCQTTDAYSFYSWQVAVTVFVNLGNWLLLFVVVFTLNTMLQEQLGRSSSIVKIALLAVLGVMGALTCGLIGVNAYLNWTQTSSYRYYGSIRMLVLASERLRMAYYVLYLLTLLASGALALKTVMSLRSRRSPGGDLIGWVSALTIAMVFWIILLIVFAAWSLQDDPDFTWETSAALSYLINFGQALSFIFLICIAKHVTWSSPAVMDYRVGTDGHGGVLPEHQQYAHNADPNAQAYYYHQAPVYNGSTAPKA